LTCLFDKPNPHLIASVVSSARINSVVIDKLIWGNCSLEGLAAVVDSST
jgi:hypothetical protein